MRPLMGSVSTGIAATSIKRDSESTGICGAER